MKKQSFKNVSKAAIVGLATAFGIGQPSSTMANNMPALQQEIKAVKEARRQTQKQAAEEIGGIPLKYEGIIYGLSPKEYGIKFGHGNKRKGKTNFLRLAHNAKLKRR